MKLKDLREWLEMIPAEYDDCQLVFREIIEMDVETPEFLVAVDDPITAATIDTESRAACFYNSESYKLTLDAKDE